MKNTSLLLASLISAGSLFAQSQRFVLIEEFTQASCPPCAQANPGFDRTMAANTAKATAIKYQVSWPGADPMNKQNPTEVATRVKYYGVGGVPDWTAGTGTLTNNSAPSQSTIDKQYAIPSPFTIDLKHWFNVANDSIFIKCVITCTQAVTLTTPALRVAMTEKLIDDPKSTGTNGEKHFTDVMRKMYPDAAGTVLDKAWTVGQTKTFTFSAKIPTYIYKKAQIATVSWIQDDGSKKVQQAGYSPSASTLPTGITNVKADNSIDVYPNPSNGLFTTSFNATTVDNYTVKISNTLGQVVFQETLNNFSGNYSKQMDVSAFGKGLYMMSVSGSKNETIKKIVAY
ncbi:MAG: T9SS type A sorting domain-containing protein [Bacteroidia bacterium]